MVIGHDADAGIRLNDPSVADCHCQIDVVDNHLTVRDLGTVHGTFVNGIRVAESILNPGDKLAIGLMTFLVGSVEEAETGPDYLEPTASGARYESAQLAPSGQTGSLVAKGGFVPFFAMEEGMRDLQDDPRRVGLRAGIGRRERKRLR